MRVYNKRDLSQVLRTLTYLFMLASLELLTPVIGQAIQDAAVYPGRSKTKIKLAFSHFGDFSNLWNLVKDEGFLDIGLFCIKRGAFLLYRNPFFEVDDPIDDVRIASGDNNCFKPLDLIGSAQPLGPINQPKQDSITFFHKPYFSSFGKATTVSVGSTFFSSIGASVKSLIVIGRTGWQITTASGKTFCVAGKGLIKDELSPICLFPDFAQSVIKQPAIAIVSAKRGCSDASKNISVSFCHYWGRAEPIDVDGRSVDFEDDGDDGTSLAGRSAFAACDAPVGEGGQTFNETLQLFKARISGSFDDDVILNWPGFGKEKWKLEMLDLIFEIAKNTIPDELMTNAYLNTIRELFLFRLEKVWTSSSGNNTGGAEGDEKMIALTEYDYRGVLFQTEECMNGIGQDYAAQSLAKWASISSPEALEKIGIKTLSRRKGANIIIEMTWLITNMVGGICHKHFQYTHNYWALYVHIVNELFLQPILPLWFSKIPNLDIILGGDMETQYKKLAICTSVALLSSNALEPFERPTNKEASGKAKDNEYAYDSYDETSGARLG